MKQLLLNRRPAWVVGVVSIAVLGSTLIATPARASSDPSATVRAVAAAEDAMGFQDDTVPDDVAVLHAGQDVTVGSGSTGMLVVPGPGEARRSTTPRATYTADQLDGTTTRLAAVLPSADAIPPEWELPPRSELVLLPDGRVSVGGPNGELLAGIDVPWAVDAAGHALPTRYEVHGAVLRQIVEATPETQFPVVADPTFTQFPVIGRQH